VVIGGKQRIENVPELVIMERGACEPWLQQHHHPALFQPFSHLVEGMMPVQNRQEQSLHATATREHMRGVGRDKPIDDRGDFSAL
jgi:hypothetical protein